MMLRSTLVKILRRSSVTCPLVVYRTGNMRFLSRMYRGPESQFSSGQHNIRVDNTSGMIDLQFEDKTEARYPFVWLRDNCQCRKCYEASSMHRILSLENIDINVHPINATIHTTDQSMITHWSDGHKSEYPVNWLKYVKFPAASMYPIDGLDVTYWGSSDMTKEKIPTYSFHDIMSDDSCLYSWLGSLHTYGFSIVNYLGDDDMNLMRLANRVAYPRTTCYGNDFVVKSSPQPSNIAYTGHRLSLHTDVPYYTHEPGIQILHCIKQSEFGGTSMFTDGFKVAHDLQREDPEIFDILSTVEFSFRDKGTNIVSKENYVLSDWKPIIRLGRNGRIQQVNFNNAVRGIDMSVGPDDVKNLYRALQIFNSALYKKENCISFTLEEGEAACFNNTRILHGRSSFTVPSGHQQRPRHLQGIYIDWDEVYARMRAIADKLK